MIRTSLTRSRGRVAGVTALLVLAVALPWALSAGGPAPAEPATGIAPGTAAMRVAIDPETGELGPTTDKAAEVQLQQLLRRDSDGLVEVVHPDGSVSIDLEGRFMNASLARIDADGELETICTTNHDHAQDLLSDEGAVREVQ